MPEWQSTSDIKWKIRVINLTEMNIVYEGDFSDKELVDELLDEYGRKPAYEMLPRDGKIGLSFSIKVDEIINRDNLVKHLWTHLIKHDDGYTKSWQIENVEPGYDRGYKKGHPDYILTYEGPESTRHKSDKVYVELKLNQDSLSDSQLEWIYQNATEGKSVYLMMINTPEGTAY